VDLVDRQGNVLPGHVVATEVFFQLKFEAKVIGHGFPSVVGNILSFEQSTGGEAGPTCDEANARSDGFSVHVDAVDCFGQFFQEDWLQDSVIGD
jgi:hypothetical protein